MTNSPMVRLPVSGERVFLKEPMSGHTTMHVGGPADRFVRITAESELSECIRLLSDAGESFAVIGRGSNLIVSDAGYRGTVLCLADGLSGITASEDGDGGMLITAGAGESISALSAFCLKKEQSGLEFAAGIPGTVGGGIRMNAGAYGGELSDLVKRVRVLTLTGEIVDRDRGEMDFGYRRSAVKDRNEIVLSATFVTKRGVGRDIAAKIRDLNLKRRGKQPLELPSAGSTWKRPEGNFAAKLIEEAGCKGLSVGGAMISEKHAGFLVNTGGATCEDIKALMRIVEKRVLENSGVKLVPEVEFL